ncbi:MAG TPA: helix-turn-helix domain-containing protein [Rhizobiaceae bacterium]|nr:helix-turn-helix domain-containing protein [Rhizobiaceae bacterium]
MFGQRLRLARKRAGLSMQALADRVTPSVSAQAISKYEADQMMPSSSVLVGLGKALGVSLDFLVGGQVEALESVEWRKNSTASAQDRAMAEAIVIEKLEDYLAIEDILDLHPAEDPFAALRVDMVADEEAIDAKARDVRREWKLGIDPIPSMTALLEDKGLKVIEADLPERINGLACHVERAEGAPTEVIVVSRHTNVERKRFNLAHELAHRIIIETGNVALKTGEGTARLIGDFLKESFRATPWSRLTALVAMGALRRLQKRMDPRRANGGVFLGLNGTVVKSHGSADATAVSAALKLAFTLAQSGFGAKLAARVASASVSGQDAATGDTEDGSLT